MQMAGSAWQFFDNVLPDDFVSELLDLILLVWQKVEVFKIPIDKRFEPRISGLLRRALISEIDTADVDLPYMVFVEDPECDPVTGKQVTRTDIDVHHRGLKIKGQKPYFNFEAKRLRCPAANNAEYIKEMQNSITDNKESPPRAAGYFNSECNFFVKGKRVGS